MNKRSRIEGEGIDLSNKRGIVVGQRYSMVSKWFGMVDQRCSAKGHGNYWVRLGSCMSGERCGVMGVRSGLVESWCKTMELPGLSACLGFCVSADGRNSNY